MITIKKFVDLINLNVQTKSTTITILDYKDKVICRMIPRYTIRLLNSDDVFFEDEVDLSKHVVQSFEVESPYNSNSINITIHTNIVRRYQRIIKYYTSEEEANQDTEFDRERS